MPFIAINNCQIHYEKHGSGSEVIVLSHGLLWSGKMFHKQVEHLKNDYTVITYDHRGQGQSEVTRGGYDMDSVYEDAVALLEALNTGPVHFGGLSMGGFVAMRLAARRPDLVKSVILMETAADDEPNKRKYTMLQAMVKIFGMGVVVKPVMKIMFGRKFLHDPARKDEMEFWRRELRSNKRSIVHPVGGVIHRKGIEDELPRIKCPALILIGEQDMAIARERAAYLHDHIRGSKLITVAGAGHTASIEEADQYNKAMTEFLHSVTARVTPEITGT